MITFDGKAFILSCALMIGLCIGATITGEIKNIPVYVLVFSHVIFYFLITINNKL